MAQNIMPLYLKQLTKNKSNIFCQWSSIIAFPHSHADFFEFGFVAKGSYRNVCNEKESTFNAKTLFLFNINSNHSLKPLTEEHIHFTVCIDRPTFMLLNQQLFGYKFDFKGKPFLTRTLTDIEFEYINHLANEISDEKSGIQSCRSFVFNVLYLLRSNYIDFTNHDNIVRDIIEKMNNYTYIAYSMREIYSQYPYSPAMLIKWFKEKTGKTIIQYQLLTRLNCAVQLITETNYSFEQITGIIGFSSTSYFFHVFKKHFGVTPLLYRKQHQNFEHNPLQLPYLSLATKSINEKHD